MRLAQGKAAWALKTTSYFGLWYFFNIFVSHPNSHMSPRHRNLCACASFGAG